MTPNCHFTLPHIQDIKKTHHHPPISLWKVKLTGRQTVKASRNSVCQYFLVVHEDKQQHIIPRVKNGTCNSVGMCLEWVRPYSSAVFQAQSQHLQMQTGHTTLLLGSLSVALFTEWTSPLGTECIFHSGLQQGGVWLGLIFLLFILRNNLHLLVFVCDYSTQLSLGLWQNLSPFLSVGQYVLLTYFWPRYCVWSSILSLCFKYFLLISFLFHFLFCNTIFVCFSLQNIGNYF